MTLQELRGIVRSFVGRDPRPVLAYTGLFAIAEALAVPARRLAGDVLDLLIETVGPDRSLLMPTYTNGFRNGLIDLDHEPCNTGMINELFRKRAGVHRTASATWSFAVLGPDAAALASLRPVDAWGEGSLFEWVEQKNAHLLMLGVPWHMCSFVHRVDWLAHVPFRTRKTFSGHMIRNGKREPLEETLFVRSRDPLVENAWEEVDRTLEPGGMHRLFLGRGQVAHMEAQALVRCLLPVLRQDPFTFVKDAEGLRVHFSQPR